VRNGVGSVEPPEGEVEERGEGNPSEIRSPKGGGGAVKTGESELEDSEHGPQQNDFQEGEIGTAEAKK
jgi:hypothetical protein